MVERTGFTLLEMMIASAISVVVALALGTFFIGTHRLVRASHGLARASLDLRAEREHLLFHSDHEGGNALWAGLLSAWKTESLNKKKVTYTATGIDASSGVSRHDRNGKTYPSDAIEPHADEVALGFSSGAVQRGNLYAVTLTRTVQGETLSERVVIPIFGLEQEHEAGRVFHDQEGE